MPRGLMDDLEGKVIGEEVHEGDPTVISGIGNTPKTIFQSV